MANIVFRRVTLDSFSKFPFVNLQIKLTVESLRLINTIKSCTQQMKKKILFFFKNMHFGVKNHFFRNSQISPKSVGLIFLAPLAFWKLLIWTSCSSYLEMISKGP